MSKANNPVYNSHSALKPSRKNRVGNEGIGIGIFNHFNDNIDENQTTTNHHGNEDKNMEYLMIILMKIKQYKQYVRFSRSDNKDM